MREYELAVVYDLAVAESGGPDASVEQLTHAVEARGGKVIKVDHWGRRRMAYPIGRAVDADYIISRIELDPADVAPLEAALRIDEKVYRHLVVRADELPVPVPPREPRQAPPQAEAAQPAPAATVAAVAESPAEAPAAEAAEPEAEVPEAETAEAAPEPAVAAETEGDAEAGPEPPTA
jgi:small subunit ribosomal protein S6